MEDFSVKFIFCAIAVNRHWSHFHGI